MPYPSHKEIFILQRDNTIGYSSLTHPESEPTYDHDKCGAGAAPDETAV
jgi:hypothetical protein